MNKVVRTLLATLASCTVLLAVSNLAAYEEAPPPSGFLNDYSKLVADPAEKDTRLVYRNPDYSMADFEALHLEELVFYLYPTDEAREIDAEEAAKMLELAGTFDSVFREELAKLGGNLVDQPGPGVLSCRWAVTDLGKSKSVARVVPVGRLAGVGRGSAAMEGECVDGATGEVVAQVVKVNKGKRTSGVTSWSGAESAVRQWAKDLATRIATKKKSGG